MKLASFGFTITGPEEHTLRADPVSVELMSPE